MQRIFGIYGAGGYGREVLPLLRDKLQSQLTSNNINHEICFIVDEKITSSVNGVLVYTFDEFCKMKIEQKYFTVAIADSKVRSEIFCKCESHGIVPFSIEANNSVIMDYVNIDSGAILSPFTCITSNVKIGKSFHANLYSYVAHDCIIGDFVTFAPGVKCNGNVIIEDYAYIGSGAVIRPGTKQKPLIIGNHAVVGMGAIVTKSVPPNKTVFGNPAKLLGR